MFVSLEEGWLHSVRVQSLEEKKITDRKKFLIFKDNLFSTSDFKNLSRMLQRIRYDEVDCRDKSR